MLSVGVREEKRRPWAEGHASPAGRNIKVDVRGRILDLSYRHDQSKKNSLDLSIEMY